MEDRPPCVWLQRRPRLRDGAERLFEYHVFVGVCLGVVRIMDFDDADRVISVTEAVQSASGIVTLLDKMFMYRTPEK